MHVWCKYVSIDMLVVVGHSLLNGKAIVKYDNELIKLDEDKMHVGDGVHWDEFKMWQYNILQEVERKELPLPMYLDCESTIQSENISIIEEEHRENAKLIIKEQSKEVANNEDKINTYSFDFIDCPIVELIKLEEE